jgi:hypothetical protein
MEINIITKYSLPPNFGYLGMYVIPKTTKVNNRLIDEKSCHPGLKLKATSDWTLQGMLDPDMMPW